MDVFLTCDFLGYLDLEKGKHPPTSAFTLIELLIVVAIIAVLAAIAVPNFLEAQVRSKVSRAITDMRSMAVALEAFRTDHKSYPSRYPTRLEILPILIQLTTPVSYMTAIPDDVFAISLKDFYEPPFLLPPPELTDIYKVHGQFARPFPFDYQSRDLMSVNWDSISSHPGTVRWALRSVGPDNIPTWLGFGAPAYDPTNGTSSYGDIYFTGPGIGLDQPKISN